jgi:hypothetical protein
VVVVQLFVVISFAVAQPTTRQLLQIPAKIAMSPQANRGFWLPSAIRQLESAGGGSPASYDSTVSSYHLAEVGWTLRNRDLCIDG